ncbi:MAG: hypothetical protein IJH62_08185 [Mogibacterium sp.]|nr:hypothetical protein [Mogibacterium sp.]
MKRFALLGENIKHTQIKRVHAELGDHEYVLIEIEKPEEMKTYFDDGRFDGFNIMHPYRNAVIAYLDELSEEAERTQSVNVVKKMPGGKLKGYNTDMTGFRYLVMDSVEGKKCLVLGTGSAARSAAAVLDDMGAADVVMVSRDPEKTADKPGVVHPVVSYNRLAPFYQYEVIVNCTSAGGYPDLGESPFAEQKVSVRLFSGLELAIDLIYDPYRTKFLQDAKRLTRCNTKSGMDMLIVQAIASLDVWLDRETGPEEYELMLRKIKRRLLESQLNVVAVGFPGSGKTTIFRRYAYELGKKFIDIDEETEKLMGRPIAEVLSDYGIGEEYFRAMEHQAVREAAVTRGSVIATGGGTLLNPLNRDYLKANGIVIYVKRPLDMLNIKGKPLSVNLDLTKLFNDRDRIYRRTSDLVLLNSRIFGEIKARTGEGNSYNYELKGFVYSIARKVQKYLNELAADIWT